MPDPPHPFPPVVRWFVSPVLLAGTGAGVGFLVSGLEGPPWVPTDELLLGGLVSLAAALGLSFSVRPIPLAVLSGLLGIALLATASFAMPPGVGPARSGIWSFAPEGMPVVVLGAVAIAIPHGVAIRGSLPRSSALIFYAAAGFAWTVLAGHQIGQQNNLFALFGVLLGASQFLALAAARDVSRKLSRRADPTT